MRLVAPARGVHDDLEVVASIRDDTGLELSLLDGLVCKIRTPEEFVDILRARPTPHAGLG